MIAPPRVEASFYDKLPRELWSVILDLLPVATLTMDCRCVCKDWKNRADKAIHMRLNDFLKAHPLELDFEFQLLHSAAKLGANCVVFQSLREKRINTAATRKQVVIWAAESGQARLVSALLRYKLPRDGPLLIDSSNAADAQEALHSAAGAGQVEVVALLLESGARRSAAAIAKAAKGNHERVLELLLPSGTEV